MAKSKEASRAINIGTLITDITTGFKIADYPMFFEAIGDLIAALTKLSKSVKKS